MKILARRVASAGASSIGGCQGAGAVVSMSSRRSQDQRARCGCSGAAWLHAVNGLGSWRQTIRSLNAIMRFTSAFAAAEIAIALLKPGAIIGHPRSKALKRTKQHNWLERRPDLMRRHP